MLLARLPGLLPPLTPREALGVTMLHSVAGTLPAAGLVQSRPFRDPHHSASMAALVCGVRGCAPARFQLIAAMNPCRCGYLGDRSGHVVRRRNAGGAIARAFQDLCWTGSTWLSKFRR